MGTKGLLTEIEAATRREERAAHKRQRELERQLKEQTKLSAAEQARLEVATYDNQLELLLSVHRDCGRAWDWRAIAVSLPPPEPSRRRHHELAARRRMYVQHPKQQSPGDDLIKQVCAEDDSAFQRACEEHVSEVREWEALKRFSQRILAGEHKAYTEALVRFSPLAELSTLGSSIHFSVQDAKTLEATLKVNGEQAIPRQVKTLTTTEKLTVKPMSRNRFYELYHDYVAGCVLRVAREVFAILPVETLLVTASADCLDTATGQQAERPVLSVIASRSGIERLDFENLDPSDATEAFPHRGKFKASRKSGAFEPIAPLTTADIARGPSPAQFDFNGLLEKVKSMRDRIRSETTSFTRPEEQNTAELTPIL
jgi:hypothetical protein